MIKNESLNKSIKSQQPQPEHWQILASFFEREGKPVSELDFTVEVYGVYALAEDWIKKEAVPVEGWQYQLKVSDLLFEEGKFNPRELTEEEKKKMEEDKVKKKPEPAKKGKVEEQSKEELDRIEKERLIQEEIRRKKEEEWNALDERTKFNRKNENKYESPWINFKNNVLSINKKEDKLNDFEEDVNDNYGFYIEFNKIPPDEDPKKKKPLPKGVNPDDLKPIFALGWLDLKDFLIPGKKETVRRVPLSYKETIERNLSKEIEAANEEKDGVQTAGTYVYLKITISNPVNPVLPEKPLPNPNDIAKKEEKVVPKITSSELCGDFRKQLKIAIEAVAKEYSQHLGDPAKNQLIRKEKANVITNLKKEEINNNINKFLLDFNLKGKAEILKEKLKRYVIRIVKDVYKKREVKGIFKNEKDQFYSELYAYLTDEVKLAMDEYIQLKKDELHEDIISSYEQSRKEVMMYAARLTKEPEEKRLLRLSKEYEIMEDYEKSIAYYKSRLTIVSNKDSWLNYIDLCKKVGNLIDVEEGINNCITFDIDDLNLKILYVCVKFLRKRLNDAIFFMNAIINTPSIGLKNTSCNFNLILAFFYKEKNEDLLYKKHIEIAKRFRLKELNLVFPGGTKKAALKSKMEKKVQLADEEFDKIVYRLCSFLNEHNYFEISQNILQFITNKTSIVYLLEMSKISLFFKDYNKVIEITNDIVSKDKKNHNAWIIRGHAYYFKKNLFDSEESYVKAIRCSTQFDAQMLYRLGMTYVNRKTWDDAKVVFLKLLKENYSFAWRYLGLSYMRLGQWEQSEEALNEANLLDVENLSIWGYLTIFCLLCGRKNQGFECVKEVMKSNFADLSILEEIGDLFYTKYGIYNIKIDEFGIASELYLKILKVNPQNSEINMKLGELYITKIENKKIEGVDYLKKAQKYCDDEILKGRISKLLEMVISELGVNKDSYISAENSNLQQIQDPENFFQVNEEGDININNMN